MKRTKALQKTYKQWLELSKSGKQSKAPNKYIHNCACCEYVARKLNVKKNKYGFVSINSGGSSKIGFKCIDKCPMKTLWPLGCENPSSLYKVWSLAYSSNDRKLAAKKISDHARDLLLGLI